MKLSEIKQICSDAAGSQGYISDATMTALANQAVQDLVSSTHCLEKRKTVACVAGQQTYAFPDDCEKLRLAAYDGTYISPATLEELRWKTNKWDSDRGEPRCWFVNGLNDEVGLWPIPGSSTTFVAGEPEVGVLMDEDGVWVDTAYGDLLEEPGAIVDIVSALELELFYYARPREMDDDDDVPDLPAWAHPAVAFFMLKEMYRSMTPMRDIEKSTFWGELYKRARGRLAIRMFNRLPKEWRVRPDRFSGEARHRYGRLPQVVDVSGS